MRLELTKRGDYGMRAMLALAAAAQTDPPERLSVRRIATAMGVPARILPSVMSRLVRADLVIASEGRSGGYVLAGPTTSVSFLAIIEAIEGDTRRRRCVVRGGPCGGGGTCSVHVVFVEAEKLLRAEFAGATLADIEASPVSSHQKEG